MNLIRRLHAALTPLRVVTFCDDCGQVCDRRCRAAAVRERARTTAAQLPRI